MTAAPDADRHPLADAWPPIEAVVLESWRVARPAIDALAAERGIPLVLHDHAELGLDTLSVAEARGRDPYSRAERFAEEFARLAADGWLEAVADADEPLMARYAVLPHAREAVRALGEAGDARLGELVAMPEGDLARLLELLEAIHAANLDAPEPPTRWACVRRFRTAGDGTPLAGRVREAALDCLAYRDDAHLAAWGAYADSASAGARWNAFTHVWSGAARTAEAIAEAAAFRGHGPGRYRRDLADLEGRGWIEAEGGEYRTTPRGQALRDAAERQTDDWFFAPWAVLGDDGVAELRERVDALLAALAAAA